MKRINKLRANHYQYYTERKWGEFKNYDLCIHSDEIGIDKSVELITNVITNQSGVMNRR